jgi:hypothetical protein
MRRKRGQRNEAVRTAVSVCALLCAGCLVTENTDLPRPSDTPSVTALSPPPHSYVPSIGDSDCMLAGPAIEFQASIYYADTQTDNLFLQLFVNNSAYGQGQQLRHTGMPFRSPNSALCVSFTDLLEDCNVVTLVVSNDLSKVDSTATSPLDPSVRSAVWYVLPPPSGDRPDIPIAACGPRLDGGV